MTVSALHHDRQSLLAALERAWRRDGASALDEAVPAEVWRRALIGPAEMFLSRPGKRLRTMLVETAWQLAGNATANEFPERLALIVELLHAGSLIIDDVQDGSELRRGAPALHHAVGVPLAINTGSWMYFWALAEIRELGLPPAQELAAHRAAATTLVRCHQGQALDLATTITDLAIHDVARVVDAVTRLKTGELCKLAAQLGALAAGAAPPVTQALARLGENVGIALQMLDDLGSLASPSRRDKAREDLRGARPTWPWAWLAERDRFAWARCIKSARAVVKGLETPDRLADLLVAEIGTFGRAQIHACLATALDDVRAVVGPEAVTGQLAAELQRMEDSYG